MDLKKYIYSHCVSPVRVRIWDSYSQGYVVRELPCGKCLHCRNTHINEWCTRLIAQRKYSKFCYYVSLDYAPLSLTDPNARLLALETAACYHDINKYHHYAMHPLVLCKNHLQDFYKRLRKQGCKVQYFACGEYGMHANGRGFGRPHFHNIIFSNEPISLQLFENAWTINGYKIGRVDFQDMTALELGSNDSIKVFKYVCKYLQKSDFDFEKLATIDFHRIYFKSMSLVARQNDLFSGSTFEFNEKEEFTWSDYCKKYSPFVVCSRRPSIGSAYFAENLERFKRQDFRLFGLPRECVAFPRYYVRRTKEALYPIRCIGEISQKPSSSSRMGRILQILSVVYDSRLALENWSESAQKSWYYHREKGGVPYICVNEKDKIKCTELSFYDSVNKFMYQFDGYGYKVWAKLRDYTYAQFDYMDIIDILREFSPSWDRFYNSYLYPMELNRVSIEKELEDTINALYKSIGNYSSYDLFLKDVYARYEVELAAAYKTKLLMQNSKQTL